jgi:hypothetical protein
VLATVDGQLHLLVLGSTTMFGGQLAAQLPSSSAACLHSAHCEGSGPRQPAPSAQSVLHGSHPPAAANAPGLHVHCGTPSAEMVRSSSEQPGLQMPSTPSTLRQTRHWLAAGPKQVVPVAHSLEQGWQSKSPEAAWYVW